MDDIVRWYTVIVCGLTMLVGLPQLRGWLTGDDPIRRLHWMSTIVLNLAIFLGTLEVLIRYSSPGGFRVYLTAVAVTWLLAAVMYRPVCRARAWYLQRESQQ